VVVVVGVAGIKRGGCRVGAAVAVTVGNIGLAPCPTSGGDWLVASVASVALGENSRSALPTPSAKTLKLAPVVMASTR
jgi:hypothetical protein